LVQRIQITTEEDVTAAVDATVGQVASFNVTAAAKVSVLDAAWHLSMVMVQVAVILV